MIYVRNIVAALAKSDPANAADYRARAAAYIKELQALDAWAKAEIAALPLAKRRVLASHDSLQYLAKAYGITLLSINGWTNNSEPSAADQARLAQQIRRENIHALASTTHRHKGCHRSMHQFPWRSAAWRGDR